MTLLIDGFAPVDAADYARTLEWDREATARRVPVARVRSVGRCGNEQPPTRYCRRRDGARPSGCCGWSCIVNRKRRATSKYVE